MLCASHLTLSLLTPFQVTKNLDLSLSSRLARSCAPPPKQLLYNVKVSDFAILANTLTNPFSPSTLFFLNKLAILLYALPRNHRSDEKCRDLESLTTSRFFPFFIFFIFFVSPLSSAGILASRRTDAVVFVRKSSLNWHNEWNGSMPELRVLCLHHFVIAGMCLWKSKVILSSPSQKCSWCSHFFLVILLTLLKILLDFRKWNVCWCVFGWKETGQCGSHCTF